MAARALRAVGKDSGKLGLAAIPARTSLRKQIGWHISQGTVHAALFQVHPDDARELLERNGGENYRNRAPAVRTIAKYVEEMKRGWRLTGEPLIISQSGRLLNGQHRLMACIDAGVSFQTMVTFGISDDAFSFLDQGRKRSAGDIFSIHGIGDYNRRASATLWVWKYFKTAMVTPGGRGQIQSPSPDVLYDFYRRHEGLDKSSWVADRFAKNKLAAPSLMMALHYLCAQFDQAKADLFFEQVATGERATGIALKLRNRLVEERIGGGRLADIYVAAFTVMSWNAIRDQRRSILLRWRGDQNKTQDFPTIA